MVFIHKIVSLNFGESEGDCELLLGLDGSVISAEPASQCIMRVVFKVTVHQGRSILLQ